MTALPFLPVGDQPLLPNGAKASEQMARLLDALLILEVQRTARVSDLALRVGLGEARLRALLSSYMVAGADAVGTAAPFTITFGTEEGPLTGHPDQDEQQPFAEVVHVSDLHEGTPLLDDLGRRAVTVEDVVRGLLCARAVLTSDALEARQRLLVQALVSKLEAAMRVTVDAPITDVAERLRAAAQARHPVSFRYRDPWSGQESHPDVEPYDVRRHRDRYFLDAGTGPEQEFWSYDISAVSELVVHPDAAFPARDLPPRESRGERLRVVLRVPKDSTAEKRLCGSWGARVVGPAGTGLLDLSIELDRQNAEGRLGVLVLQLGPGVTVLHPEQLASAAVTVARRLLDGLPT